MKPVSNETLLTLYGETGSVWKTAERVGLCGQTVHERLQKLGATKPINIITDEERAVIRARYEAYASIGRIGLLAKEMGRSKHLICRIAGELGLTNQRRSRTWLAVWKYIDETAARTIFEDFKCQSLGLTHYCKRRGYDRLGFSQTMRRFFHDEWEHVLELKVPAQSLYRLGRSFEYRVRDHLTRHKFLVTRSPASRSPVDLFAIGRGTVLLIQCKRAGQLGVDEWNEIFRLADSVGAIPILAVMKEGNRGVAYFELTDFKDGSKRRQPMAAIEIAEQGIRRASSRAEAEAGA